MRWSRGCKAVCLSRRDRLYRCLTSWRRGPWTLCVCVWPEKATLGDGGIVKASPQGWAIASDLTFGTGWRRPLKPDGHGCPRKQLCIRLRCHPQASLKRRNPPCSSFRGIRSFIKEIASIRMLLMHPGELSALICAHWRETTVLCWRSSTYCFFVEVNGVVEKSIIT